MMIRAQEPWVVKNTLENGGYGFKSHGGMIFKSFKFLGNENDMDCTLNVGLGGIR